MRVLFNALFVIPQFIFFQNTVAIVISAFLNTTTIAVGLIIALGEKTIKFLLLWLVATQLWQ
jgi:hypothetical protein